MPRSLVYVSEELKNRKIIGLPPYPGGCGTNMCACRSPCAALLLYVRRNRNNPGGELVITWGQGVLKGVQCCNGWGVLHYCTGLGTPTHHRNMSYMLRAVPGR